MNVLLSNKVPVGIIDTEFPASLDETIDAIKQATDKPIHIVDYCAWKEDYNTIKKRLKAEDWEMDDHHNAFSNTGFLSAASSVIQRYNAGNLVQRERIVLTCRPNFDNDLILSTLAALSSIYRTELIEKISLFSDSTMFGGEVFDSAYGFRNDIERLSFGLSQRIYEETVKNFPQDMHFLKGFPANKPAIARAVLNGYESIIDELLHSFESLAHNADKYLQRVQNANSNAKNFSLEMIPGIMTYLDLRDRMIDTMPPMPFWLVEASSGFIRNNRGSNVPIVLRESKTGYVLGSADTRKNNGELVEYDLRKIIPQLSELSGKPWFGKDIVVFGSRTNDATPENIAKVISAVYK